MDYERIYRELIADRRANPPSADEYAEVHHILPRCMGGGDKAENLIRLRPEDHFFAHLLLAKAHDTHALWGAVIVMHARKPRSQILYKRSRERYGFARRRYGQLCSEVRAGDANPNFNPEKITLKNLNGDVVSANRLEWATEYDIPHAALRGVMTGKSKSYKGWMLPSTDPCTTGTLSGKNHPKYDATLRYWRHVDGRVVVAAKSALAERYGLRVNDLGAVIRGQHGHHCGWYIDPSKIGWNGKPNRVLGRDDAEYTIYHLDGRKATGNRRTLSDICGIDQRDVSALLCRSRKSSGGWMVKDIMDAGYIPNIKPDGYVAANDNVQPDLFAFAA